MGGGGGGGGVGGGGGRSDEWLLNVDVGPGEERSARRLEVRAGRGADVNEIRPPNVEQFAQRVVAGGAGQVAKSPAGTRVAVVYADHHVRRAHAPQTVEVEAGHVASADEGYSERSHVPRSRQ